MSIELNKKGIIIKSKDKDYLSNEIYIETASNNNDLCYIITTDEFGSGDVVCSVDTLDLFFKEHGWEVEWESGVPPQEPAD